MSKKTKRVARYKIRFDGNFSTEQATLILKNAGCTCPVVSPGLFGSITHDCDVCARDKSCTNGNFQKVKDCFDQIGPACIGVTGWLPTKFSHRRKVLEFNTDAEDSIATISIERYNTTVFSR